jgi:hypothetical protein
MNINQFSQQEQENWNQIFKKCYEDETFKRALISNPVQALETLNQGKPIDLKGFKLIVTDQSEQAIYINIPVNEESLELSEEQLEMVAGGGDCWICSSCSVTSTVIIYK